MTTMEKETEKASSDNTTDKDSSLFMVDTRQRQLRRLM